MALTVKELIALLLNLVEDEIDADAMVVLSKDGEGNSFSPLDGYSISLYEANNTWNGTVYSKDEDPEDLPGEENLEGVLVLWPTN